MDLQAIVCVSWLLTRVSNYSDSIGRIFIFVVVTKEDLTVCSQVQSRRRKAERKGGGEQEGQH